MYNRDVRAAAKDAGVRLYELAHEIGITDGNLSRRLRWELSETEKADLIEKIQAVAARKEALSDGD